MMTKKNKTIVVGAGMSGLTASIYLARANFNVLLIEQNKFPGGLINSFERDGFVFDGGARSIENSGVLMPMLEELGIKLDLIESKVSIGIEDYIINYESKDSINDFKQMLISLFPENSSDIDNIIAYINIILTKMVHLYGVDNPYFKDLKKNKEYLMKEVLPWLPKFLSTVRKIRKMMEPVESVLANLSKNQSLIDIIDQHFFKNIPSFFALGYYYIYTDYFYPKGGTGKLPESLAQKFLDLGGKIQYNTKIIELNPYTHLLKDDNGNEYFYDHLIWSANLKNLYSILDTSALSPKIQKKIEEKKELYSSKRGGDSVFTVYLAINEPLDTFRQICNPHFFYTPYKQGLGDLNRGILNNIISNFHITTKEEILNWLDEFCKYNSYEISIPGLRDSELVPEGKTGLIISTLFEYNLVKKIKENGWYEEFKEKFEEKVIKYVINSLNPHLVNKIAFKFSSTPLTFERYFGTSEGAITGWSFESELPVIHDLLKMPKSVVTPIPDVLQAGQWVYSPAGIPTAILTGWNAAQRIIKKHK